MRDPEVTRDLLLRFKRSEDWVDPYFNAAEDSLKLYRQYRDATDWPYVNSIFTPDTFGFVEDATAKVVQAHWASEPFFSVQPRYGADPELAKQLERGLQHYVAYDEEAEFYLEFEEYIKSGAIYGNGYLGLYPRIKFMGKEPYFAGLQFTCKDFWEILPDPRARRLNSRARYTFDRELTYREDLEDLKRAGIFDYNNLRELQGGGDTDDQHKELLQDIGVEDYVPSDEELFELLHLFIRGDVVTLCNRKEIIRDTRKGFPRPGGNPYLYGIPLVDYKYVAIPREFYGLGIPTIIKALQEDKNLLKSQRRENIDLILNKIVKYKTGRGLNLDSFVFFPGAFWPMRDPTDVEFTEMNDVTGSAYKEEEEINMGMEMATGQFRYSMGQSPERRETGVGIVRLQQAAMARFDTLIKRTEFHSLRSLARRSIAYIRAYEDPERWQRIIGESDRGFFQLPLSDILEMFDFTPMGSSVTAIKEQRAQQKLMARDMLFSIPPELQMAGGFQVDYYEAALLGLDGLDIQAKERYIRRAQQAAGGAQQGFAPAEVPLEALLTAIGEQEL